MDPSACRRSLASHVHRTSSTRVNVRKSTRVDVRESTRVDIREATRVDVREATRVGVREATRVDVREATRRTFRLSDACNNAIQWVFPHGRRQASSAAPVPSIPVSLELDAVGGGDSPGHDVHSDQSFKVYSHSQESVVCLSDSHSCNNLSRTSDCLASSINSGDCAVTSRDASSRPDTNAADVQWHHELEIKKEVEETYPQLRHIIEGRSYGQERADVTKEQELPAIANFQALN